MPARTLSLLVLLAAAGCTDVPLVPSADLEAARFSVAIGDGETQAVMALVNSASYQVLDVDVGLDRRAAAGIVTRRPLADLAALDAVPFVGNSALRHLIDYAIAEGLVVHDVAEGSALALDVLEVANLATLDVLQDDVLLDLLAAQGIVDARPLDTLAALDAVLDVDAEEFALLVAYVDSGAFHVDADGDGVPASLDCDDTDAAVHPGALEICDGLDNDCDDTTAEDGVVTHDGRTNYADVATAVDAITGGTLAVCPGVYLGEVTIDVPLRIVGIGLRDDIVLSSEVGRSITVHGTTGVSIENLTVTTTAPASVANVGGVRVDNGGQASLVQLDVRDNRFATGAGVSVSQHSSVTLSDSVIQRNVATASGGGLYIYDDSTVTLVSSVLDGNVASEGGGFDIEFGSTLDMTDSAITANVALVRGGGGFMGGPWATGDDLFGSNTDWGTGATANQPSDITIENTYVTEDFEFDGIESYNQCSSTPTWSLGISCY